MSTNVTQILPPTPTPSMIAQQYGISISEATHIQNNYWSIPQKYKRNDILPVYFILSWDVDYFRDRIREGTILREHTVYQVIYHRTNPVEIAKGKGQVMLSFRSFNRDFNIQPTVLVSLSHKMNTRNNHNRLPHHKGN